MGLLYRVKVDSVNTLLIVGADVNISDVKVFSPPLLPAKMGKIEHKKGISDRER